ncbi:MAG: carotenoid oxygenase family protein [Acidobacteria bacterium]|nr:MAG: carotenoid oxygenase family protein [Acidobacteriota bacterium]GIK77974.1 MAG: 15,15' beta carotene dioxygenase [Actinomycetes bacterium]
MGYGLGFETLERETRIEALPVEGEIPGWLGGSLLRTGPARFEVGARELSHWFDGLAMLHRFGFAGGAVSYANRYLESRAYRAVEETGAIGYSEFATDPCRSLFRRAMSLFQPALSDNCNVNLVRLGERFVAMTETPLPVEFDPATLAAAGVGWKVPGQLTTAHPHLDRGGGMLNYAARLGPRSSYRFFRLAGAPGATPEIVASLPTRRPAYMHSFGLTERWLVLAEFPFVVNPAALALSGRPYIENYRWRPELGTRFTLLDRSGGEALGPFTADPCFGFHHVNAFEDAHGDVVADVCAFDDAGIVKCLYLDVLRAGRAIPAPELTRFTISPATGAVARERLVDEPVELPRIDYGRCNGRPYRYAWGAGTDGSGFFDRIVRADLRERTTVTWSETGCWPGEPVFVARPDAGDEGDGVLLSVVLDGAAGSSFLLVLDAATLAEVGRAIVPHHVPFGFHGQYAAAA